MDKPVKLKSINNVSIVWLEECSEVKYAGYKELIGRLRHPTLPMHFIMTTNPVDEQSWVYSHFFVDEEESRKIVNPETFYKERILVKDGVYYHHSVPDDNMFLPEDYIQDLDDMEIYDPDLYRVARLGRFGSNGMKVLPQFEVMSHSDVMRQVQGIPNVHRFNGMDFGFEVSYNAIVRMAVDDKDKTLYIYDEYYKNKMTDDKTLADLRELKWDKIPIIADSAEPKTIEYLWESGCDIRKCSKFQGSRLENTKKMKRFRRIVVSARCKNTVNEWKNLTYAKDARGKQIYDKFNIDAHTFSAAWYGLDMYDVADVKMRKNNSVKGN
jgi:phage terminase large subunit